MSQFINKKIQYLFEYALLRLFCSFVRLLPSYVTISIGGALAKLSLRFMKKRMLLAHSNLQGAYADRLSQSERDRILSNLMGLLGETFIESIIITTQDVRKNIRIEGTEHLEKALHDNKGAIILAPHFGVWELSSHVFGLRFPHTSVIYKPLKNPYVDTYIKRVRQKSNLELIPNKQALRVVVRNLKKGYFVGILFDQNAGKEGIPASFFGKMASTYSAPAVFALKTGCAVLPAYMVKASGFRQHRLVIGERFPLITTGNQERDVLANTQQYNDFLEALIYKHPDQWFGWLHKRWKIPSTFAEKKVS